MRQSSGDQLSRRWWSIARRLPLTLVFMIGTTLLAIATGALSGGTAQSTIDRFGYSLDHLRAGELYVIPFSDWLVVGPSHWSSMLLLYALFAAPLEWFGGTWLLARTFVIGSWVGTVITSLFVLAFGSAIGWNPHPDLIHEADVGGSVGAWAAAGAINVIVGRRFPWLVWPIRIGSAIYLGNQVATEHGTADVAHILGLCIGCAIGFQFLQHRGPTRLI